MENKKAIRQESNLFPQYTAAAISTVSSSSSDDQQQENSYEIQNRKLRNKIFDFELKQRQYISKILQLQTNLAKINLTISNNLSKKSRSSIESNMPLGVPITKSQKQGNKIRNQSKQKSKEKEKQKQRQKQKDSDTNRTANDEKKFCEVVSKTYGELFGISSLKQIWKKHKQILQDWLLFQNSSQRK